MKNRHISFEKIILISNNISVADDVERIHLENCKICQNRLSVAKMLDEGIKESVKTEPLIDLNLVDVVADEIFDKCSGKRNQLKFRKTLLFVSSVAAGIVVFMFVSGWNGSIQKKESNVDLFVENNVPESIVPKQDEPVPDPVFPEGVFKMNKGSEIGGAKYSISAKTDILIVHENDNYFSIKKGTASISVKSGNEFMVNLNNSVLVRVLGTVFTVSVLKNQFSVEVSEGLVEIIDLEKGVSSTVSKGQKEIISKIPKPYKTDVFQEESAVLEKEEFSAVDIPVKKQSVNPFNLSNDPALFADEIKDLENVLKYSGAPVVQLHRLFELYRRTGQWGSVLHFWKNQSSQISSRGNPFLKEMHFAACEASINIYLYDNGVCRKYRKLYPEGPDPEGMDDHLKMAW